MTRVIFTDYLHDTCDVAWYSKVAMVKPNSIRGVFDYKFTFHLSFDLESIKRQAAEFANEALMIPGIVKTVSKNVQGPPKSRRDSLSNVYIYSYMKAYNFCVMIQESEGNFGGNPLANSVAFGGHVEVFKSFYDTFQLSQLPDKKSNTAMFRTLTIKDYDIKAFKDSDFFKNYNEGTRKFYFQNSELERLLQALQIYNEDSLWITPFTSDLILDQSRHPLGTCCFHTDETCSKKEVLFVNNVSSILDTQSKFWNIANCIFLETCDKAFTRCALSPYSFIDYDNLADTAVYGEIYSITGLNVKDKYSTYGSGPIGDPSYGLSPQGSGPNVSDGTPGSGVNSDDLPGKKPNKATGSKPKSDGGGGRVKSFVDASKHVGGEVLKTVGDVLRNEEVQKTILQHALNSNKKQKGYLTLPDGETSTTTTIGGSGLPFKRETTKTTRSYSVVEP